MEKVLMKGNDAMAEGAIRGGCDAYFGYPITPQSEMLEYMARRMPELGRVFVQAESEVAGINMVYGAAAVGARAMTSSSGPGISLMQEAISTLAAAELPAVIVNVMRAGPGVGGILPAQADYFQATRGGGHGDHHSLVLAPWSVQEAMDLTSLAFDLADTYRNPVMVLADGLIGQAMEPVVLEERESAVVPKDWILSGRGAAERKVITTLRLAPEELESLNRRLVAKYAALTPREVRYSTHLTGDAEYLLVAYGTCGRVARAAIAELRASGVKAGLIRPITLFPFPYEAIREAAERARAVVVVEMSSGQLLQDVELAVKCGAPLHLVDRLGGIVPSTDEVVRSVEELMG
jgi:2-oxoglutarate ferredoxin oxidoreductase subunit alpha